MDEIEFYCSKVICPLIKERDNLVRTLSSKLYVTKKEKELLSQYNQKLNECYKHLEILIDDRHSFIQSLIKYGIINREE